MKFINTLTILAFLFGSINTAQAQTQKVGFSVIEATDSYDAAFRLATIVADSLDIEFRNEVIYDKGEGLKDTVTCGCGEQHGYIKRGRNRDGVYVSIELNDRYTNSPDEKTYAVIAMSYAITDKKMKESLLLIKSKFPEAKYFDAEIYVGCMH